jgi:hypothetical protein
MFDQGRLREALVLKERSKANGSRSFVKKDGEENQDSQAFILSIIFPAYYSKQLYRDYFRILTVKGCP